MVKLVVCVVVAGCQSNHPAAKPIDAPCTPTVHTLARRGPPQFEAFKWLGGSSDGKRVAYAVSHLGPGSGEPVGGAHVMEAGASKAVLDKSYFAVHGDESMLPKVEDGIVTDLGGEITAAGVELGANLPRSQAWCTAGGKIYNDTGAIELKVSRAPCVQTPAKQAVSWEVCAGTRCTRFESTACLDGEVTLLDLARSGNVDWAVVDVATKPFGDAEFHLYQVAGISGS
ncbi:MAG: hypothetical protein QM831_26910 [Kofleriaceae bacterium]